METIFRYIPRDFKVVNWKDTTLVEIAYQLKRIADKMD